MSDKHENQLLLNIMSYLKKIKVINIFKYLMYVFDRIICFFIGKPNKSIDTKKQVLILANLNIGDSMNYLSVVDKYRKAYPKEKYEITLYVGNHLDELFKQETEFDNIELVEFNKSTTNLKNRIGLIKKIREKYYDVVIDPMGPTGCTPSMYFMASCYAKEKISIVNKKYTICPKYFLKKIYTNLITIDKKEITNIEFYHRLINELMIDSDNKIEFHKIKRLKLDIELPDEYYVVFPSASLDLKKWNYEKYSELIERIYEKTCLPVVFCGTESDRKDVNEVTKNLKNAKFIDVLGKSSVLEFIEIIRNAKFVISNDTGAYHIAVNHEVPVAIIAGGYVYSGFIAYDFNNNYRKPYIIVDKRECFNCNYKCKYIEKASKIWPCLEAITLEYAWKIVEKMIDDIKEETK